VQEKGFNFNLSSIGLPLCDGSYLGLFLLSICVMWMLVYLMEDVSPKFFPPPMPLIKAP